MKRIAGIAGLAIPSFFGLTMEVAYQLPGEHAVLAAAMLAYLGHVLADLTAGRAEHVLAGFERAGNHDLEFAFAVSYRQALQTLRDETHAIDHKDRQAYIDRLLKGLEPRRHQRKGLASLHRLRPRRPHLQPGPLVLHPQTSIPLAKR